MTFKIEALITKKFGLLTVVNASQQRLNGCLVWECRCDCGNLTRVRSRDLRKQKSCGCVYNGQKKHGESTTRLYNIWHCIKQRCENSFSDVWKEHNSLQPEWRHYLAFKKWALDHAYSDTKNIRRQITKNGFNEANCYWADTH